MSKSAEGSTKESNKCTKESNSGRRLNKPQRAYTHQSSDALLCFRSHLGLAGEIEMGAASAESYHKSKYILG